MDLPHLPFSLTKQFLFWHPNFSPVLMEARCWFCWLYPHFAGFALMVASTFRDLTISNTRAPRHGNMAHTESCMHIQVFLKMGDTAQIAKSFEKMMINHQVLVYFIPRPILSVFFVGSLGV
jgi:hypothetical protein